MKSDILKVEFKNLFRKNDIHSKPLYMFYVLMDNNECTIMFFEDVIRNLNRKFINKKKL